jgi:hypothetical protein
MMTETKVCSNCGIEKPSSEFYTDHRKKGKLRAACKECSREKQREYEKENIDKRFEYRKKNIDKIRKKQKEHYEKNLNKYLEYQREYRLKNKERLLEQKKVYYLKKKKQIKKYKKKYYDENLEKILKYQDEYRKKHEDKLLEQKKVYYQDNRDRILRYAKKSRTSIVSFKVYTDQLTTDESPISDAEGNLLVKCTYCGRYYYPNREEVQRRLGALKGRATGEHRLYCSDNCKNACPVYRKILYPAGQKAVTSREVQPELRQMRLACDEYACQRCGKTIDDAQLHCHHIEGIVQNPIESADLDNTITLCKRCHKWAHTQEGCRYFELRCE